MPVASQTTIAQKIRLAGVGLHSGVECHVTINPAHAGSGVSFCRNSGAIIPAAFGSIVETQRCTRLGAKNGDTIDTVEHVMAAFAIASIDNAFVEIDGPEMPILDGSALPYVVAIRQAGVSVLDARRQALRIVAPIEVHDGARMIRAEPCEQRQIEVAIDFEDRAIGAQALKLDLDREADLLRLQSARTFCRLSEVEAMRDRGLSLGGSLANAIVVDGDRIINPEGLRDPAEFALHKALDLVGDLRLAGAPIIGRIVARRPGHDLNARFLARLLAQGEFEPAGSGAILADPVMI